MAPVVYPLPILDAPYLGVRFDDLVVERVPSDDPTVARFRATQKLTLVRRDPHDPERWVDYEVCTSASEPSSSSS